MMGRSLSLSARVTVGSPTSLLKPRRTPATLSRTSCTAVFTSILSSNSTITRENPSRENERILLIPLMVLIASSMGRVTSCITASEDAPG